MVTPHHWRSLRFLQPSEHWRPLAIAVVLLVLGSVVGCIPTGGPSPCVSAGRQCNVTPGLLLGKSGWPRLMRPTGGSGCLVLRFTKRPDALEVAPAMGMLAGLSSDTRQNLEVLDTVRGRCWAATVPGVAGDRLALNASLRWAPNGQVLLVCVHTEGHEGRLFWFENGALQEVAQTEGVLRVATAVWHPSGTYASVAGHDARGEAVFRVSGARLSRRIPLWRPDGNQLAVQTNAGVALYDAAGRSKAMLRIPGNTLISAWVGGGEKLALLAVDSVGMARFSSTKLVLPGNGWEDARWSADGLWLLAYRGGDGVYLFSWRGETRGRLWSMAYRPTISAAPVGAAFLVGLSDRPLSDRYRLVSPSNAVCRVSLGDYSTASGYVQVQWAPGMDGRVLR